MVVGILFEDSLVAWPDFQISIFSPSGSWRTETLRTVQFIGTLALFYGILRAHPRHKDKLLLVWLATAIYCALSMAIAGLQLWLSDGIFTAIFYPWTLAGECVLSRPLTWLVTLSLSLYFG